MDLSDSCESCKFHNGNRIDNIMQGGEFSRDTLRCGILSTKDKKGKTREAFIPRCPCRSCLLKMVCPYDYRMIFDKGTKCCPMFQEFMGEILEHFYKLWLAGELKNVEHIRLVGERY